jgi:predicted nuclease with TOPRIM domain
MSDAELMLRERDLLEEMHRMVEEHARRRTDRVQGLDRRLDELEDEREKNLYFFTQTL